MAKGYIKMLALAVVAVITAGMIQACGPAAEPGPAATPAPGSGTATPTAAAQLTPEPPTHVQPAGTLRASISSISSSLPLTHFQGSAAQRIYLGGTIFEWFIYTDLDGALIPGLATDWHTEDAQNWDLTIRPGVTFPNGREMTVEDVAFSVNAQLEHGEGSAGTHFRRVLQGATVLDENTVRITAHEPNWLLYFDLAKASFRNLWTVPQDYFTEVGYEGFIENPMGTGPYEFVERTPGSRVTVQVRPDVLEQGHWRLEPIYWERIQAHNVSEDSTRLALLKTDSLDIAEIPAALLDQAEGFQVARSEGVTAGAIGLCCVSDRDESPFNDVRVRKALNLAVDMDSIARNIFKGEIVRQAVFNYTENVWGFDPSLEPYPYDPEEAKRLAQEANFPPPGYRLVFHLRTDAVGIPDIVAAGEAIGGYWERHLGVDVEFRPMEHIRLSPMTLLQEPGTTQMQAPGIWNNAWTPRSSVVADPGQAFNAAMGCKDIFGGTHSMRVTCSEVDEWMLEYFRTPDPADRDEISRQIQRWLYDNYIHVPIGAANQLFVIGPKVATYTPPPGFPYAENLELTIPNR
jgi:peptide/nickel transport system substrate-binding protein